MTIRHWLTKRPQNMSSSLPTDLYQSLILKLVIVLELTQKPDGFVTPQAKQALLQAVRYLYILGATVMSIACTRQMTIKVPCRKLENLHLIYLGVNL